MDLTEVSQENTIQKSLTTPTPISDFRYQVIRGILTKDYDVIAKDYGEYNIIGFIKDIVRRIIL